MDSKIPTLVKVLELTGRDTLCESVACPTLKCGECPFNTDKDLDDLIALLKTYELLES
ncbi:coil containing protein [Vibrio phage 1.097.O._10N.286.49.B3]|uniref:Coil containing protein n=1 Tax=Vibrio phage 1.097.O._10N.286.49.B3 TaxID=1881383 RepID=A0A2I7R0Q9_9CAUD|nr:coil containing protein [Vibrio phage 1.097.O._10N.286.49.B3]AUR87233.1 coil containing protein [Vibrio phage 1.097.O._10N.286.49.B3]